MNIWVVPRPAFAEVNLKAIANNVAQIKKVLAPQTQLMAVVKANAYGHGAEKISHTVLKNGADRLGVATLGEGVCLRMAGIMAPILVLGYVAADQTDVAIKYNIIQTVYTLEAAEAISQKAKERNKTATIHLKIDTGMGRIGFLPGNEESLQQIERIFQLPNLYVEGIYTHLARADERDKTFAYEQLASFDDFLSKMRQKGLTVPIVHAANSAATMELPQSHYNMVRPGIVLYGHRPSDEVDMSRFSLQPALTLRAQVSCVKELPPGSPIGYGSKFVTQRRSVIASLPVGYADGFSRLLFPGYQVLIRGKRCPVVGNICMDQMMVDITELGQVPVGEEAILIGKQGDDCITVEEIAKQMGTINYEVICMLSERLPRVYVYR